MNSKYEPLIQKADIHALTKGYHQLVDMEIELESKLKTLRECKARFMIEIDLRINKK